MTKAKTNKSHTATAYGDLDRAYAYFNKKLFGGRLPDCLITLRSHMRNAWGYYHHDNFKVGEEKIAEISLNSASFDLRDVKSVLSTLVHEMVHLEQFHFGKPGKNGYHNKEWGDMMRKVGLHPSATGAVGGKEVGRAMTHYIISSGPFEKAYSALMASAPVVLYHERAKMSAEVKKRREKSNASKTKYTCSGCDQNAWAKPGASLVCGECEMPMESEQ